MGEVGEGRGGKKGIGYFLGTHESLQFNTTISWRGTCEILLKSNHNWKFQIFGRGGVGDYSPTDNSSTDNSLTDNSTNGQFVHKYCSFIKNYEFMD